MKISIKDLYSQCVQIPSFLRIGSHLLKKFLMRNFLFSAVKLTGSISSFKVPFQRATEEYNIVLSAQFEKFEYESF